MELINKDEIYILESENDPNVVLELDSRTYIEALEESIVNLGYSVKIKKNNNT